MSLTSTLDGDEWSATRPGHFPSPKPYPVRTVKAALTVAVDVMGTEKPLAAPGVHRNQQREAQSLVTILTVI